MLIGEKIKYVLKERGWSANRLSRLLGVSPATMSRIIKGGDTASALAFRIAEALGESATWLADENRDLSERRQLGRLDPAAIPESELIELTNARIERLISLENEALAVLRSLSSHRTEASGAMIDAGDKLGIAMTRHAAGARFYAFLLHALVEIAEKLNEVESELRRVIGFGNPWPGPGDFEAAKKMLASFVKLYANSGQPLPWERSFVNEPEKMKVKKIDDEKRIRAMMKKQKGAASVRKTADRTPSKRK